MAIEIKWTQQAIETFKSNIDYLASKWSNKEITKFVQETEKIINRLQKYPESYPPGIKDKRYRKVRINKYIVLFYRYFESKKKISLITFWHVRQDPDQLKY